jgi:multidrug transporter EmrE-like cation transporter
MKAYIFAVPFQVWILLSVICYNIGELFTKKVVLGPTFQNVGLMHLFYTLGALLWLPALAIRKDLGTTGAIWSMTSLIVTVTIGVKYYGEQLLVRNMVGLVFALIAIVLFH